MGIKWKSFACSSKHIVYDSIGFVLQNQCYQLKNDFEKLKRIT